MKKNLVFSLLVLRSLGLVGILLLPVNIFAQNGLFPGYTYIKPKFKSLVWKSTPINSCSLFNTVSSTNWAGYVASTNIFNPQKHTVRYVEGTWVIPSIASGEAKPGTFYAIWVGIDGLNNNTIEQLGTAYQFIGGKQINYAWFEMFPKGSMEITNFPVKPGQSITASVKFIGNGVGQYQLIMKNNTTKKYTVIPAAMTRRKGSPRTCCEWIVEAPSFCDPSCAILPLAHFNPVTLKNCKATIKGVKGAIRNPAYQNLRLNMASRNGTIKALTSPLNTAGNRFKVTWKHR